MVLPEDDLSTSSALVIDANPTSRSMLVSQLRDFGMGSVVQVARLLDARRQLELRNFDVVLCELHFEGERMTGQDLLDDLRRNQLLPFATVFIMVTGEATYAKVAEAAESALDGYLLKPHKANQLAERLRQARFRKTSLQEIFSAIEADDFETASSLCQQRFESKGLFWLYAARVGAELMLRLGKYAQAQKLYQAVVAAKTLPWAKLGVARALIDEGQVTRAVSALENLISEDPSYTDAYDVMGRAQFEQGKFDEALSTYKMASDLTPSSITRLQNLGLMSYYSGDRQGAEALLDRTTRLGLDSKMFDCQTLVLLALVRFESGDRKGLQRCSDDFARLMDRQPTNTRLQRLSGIVDALQFIEYGKVAQAVASIRSQCQRIKAPEFDFESAANLLALLAQLAHKTIQLDEVEVVVDTLGKRFAGTRALAELLAGSAAIFPPYAELVRTAHANIIKLTEAAITMSMRGDPQAAVVDLLRHGQETLSSKLIETAYLVMHRYADEIPNTAELTPLLHELRMRYGTKFSRATLGEPKRQAGGLTLRAGRKSTPATPAG